MRSRTVSFLLLAIITLHAQQRSATVHIGFTQKIGTLDPGRISLGQGGLSADPIWNTRALEIRALHPKLIRLFIQEYFDLMPSARSYNFEALDRSVDLILETGAEPLMNIDFKPHVLYRKIDQDVVEPSSWKQWEELIFALVRHYQDRQAHIQYWEIANEPDIGESGGCPYRFTPENYLPYYQHTASAVLRADPNARVGGPALANCKSDILPALIQLGAQGKAPVHFISWHAYSSEPAKVRQTIDYVNGLLAKQPSFKPDTILDEWNMSLSNPVRDPAFQPCYIAETAYQMLDAGLTYSCYYHIRDYYVDVNRFSTFMSAQGAAFMGRWWNRMPQFDGLFDYQDTVRPAYYSFKLLSRLSGDRLSLESSDSTVHGLFTYDPLYLTHNLMLWNFSPTPVHILISANDVPELLLMRPELLDAKAASYDENARLRPLTAEEVEKGKFQLSVDLEPWGVAFWSFEPVS